LNKRILALSLILVLTAVCLISVSTTRAQTATSGPTGGWITQYTVQDSNTGATIVDTSKNQYGAILQGEELEVTATIHIGQSGTNLQLTTNLDHSSLQGNYYWQDQSSYSLGNFNPNSKTIVFPETVGTLVISCFGLVPTGSVTQTGPNGITLDIPTPLNLMILEDPNGATLDQITLNITDSAINNYLAILSQKESSLSSLKSQGIDPGFIQMYSNVISESEALEGEGFATEAAQMLNGLNVSTPPSASTVGILIPVAGVMAAIAVIFAFLFLRIRGKVSYIQLVVEDQIKDLEGLTLRISRIDRMASSNLESVKDRLKRLVGM